MQNPVSELSEFIGTSFDQIDWSARTVRTSTSAILHFIVAAEPRITGTFEFRQP